MILYGFWSFPGGPHQPTLLQNPEKWSFACQWGLLSLTRCTRSCTVYTLSKSKFSTGNVSENFRKISCIVSGQTQNMHSGAICRRNRGLSVILICIHTFIQYFHHNMKKLGGRIVNIYSVIAVYVHIFKFNRFAIL